jgi:DNA mismatch repair protein MutS2
MIVQKTGIIEWIEMNHKSIEELGFFQVLAHMKAKAMSEEGKRRLDSLGFLHDRDLLVKRQQQVAGAVDLLIGGLSLESFPPIAQTLESLSDPIKQIDCTALLDIALYIRAATHLCQAVHAEREDDSLSKALHSLMSKELSPALLSLQRLVHETLDESAQVRTTHPRLLPLYRQVEAAKTERARFCSQFIKSNVQAVQSEQEALRDGRLVIPVRNDRRAMVQGFISSTSQTGNTVFMEPYALVEMNNNVVLAQNQIQIEIARILKSLNDAARQQRNSMLSLADQVGDLDAIFSIAAWVLEYQAQMTDLDSNKIKLKSARHPLLGKKAVPITISLDDEVKAVVISGPNAGGKTVTIKTVGLFALLNQFCGYLPASHLSSLPLFDAVFTDIGDEQSITEELSTFSGHMKQVGSILGKITQDSLVILDELGSGTDPVEGSALARAILEYCLKKAKLTLVSSHHGVLKQFAYAKKDVINASMEFNEHSHMPTFKVIQGLPGESHALDTARHMKLPLQVIHAAEQYLGSEAVEIGSIIKDLERIRGELKQKEEQMRSRYLSMQKEVKDLELAKLKVKQKEAQLRSEQTTALERFMVEKRKELENLVGELRREELTKEKTRCVKSYLKSLEDKVLESQSIVEEQQNELEGLIDVQDEQLQEGMDVLCGSSKRLGRILKKQGKNKYLVAIDSIRMTIDAKQLSIPRHAQSNVSVSYHSSAPTPKMVLDVRGLTLSDTLQSLEQQIESALVHGMSSFSIIHGYGDGILSKGISQFLEKNRNIKGYRYALPEDGGMGKTYVEL